ncbi:hypothetical protein M5K25_008546 [Dendrobium thyrsiflorum]|uniref:Uncharacterized protein n=1 Tax=Dendrobium thyrsiflorum TaxID=117978 RepID=A0ABD0V9J6_DENTH
MAAQLSGAPSGIGPVKRLILIDPGFLSYVNKSRSFKDVISGTSSSSAFPDLRSLWVSKEDVLALAAPFQFCSCWEVFYA